MFNFAATSATPRSYHTPWFMFALVGAALLFYASVEWWHTRDDHEIKMREAVWWSIVYVALALAFTIPVYLYIGKQASAEYIGAWAIEKALSLDNLFVMGVIFVSFRTPKNLQRRMLNYGIAGAIVFRLIFILAGTSLLATFEWISLVFGAILLRASWKALQQARGKGEEMNARTLKHTFLWRGIAKIMPIHPQFMGKKLSVKIKGRRMLTMMAAVILLIELTDIIFAVDSVPAVLAVSPDKFIAYSSNVFALLGLRALYFVYQAVADRFWALSWTLCLILAWVAFKLMVMPFGLHVPIALSLSVLGALLASGIGISLIAPRPRIRT